MAYTPKLDMEPATHMGLLGAALAIASLTSLMDKAFSSTARSPRPADLQIVRRGCVGVGRYDVGASVDVVLMELAYGVGMGVQRSGTPDFSVHGHTHFLELCPYCAVQYQNGA